MDSILDIIKSASIALFPGVLTLFIISSIIFYQKDKIYRYQSTEWFDVKKYPIPKDIKGFIGTDGKKVQYIAYIEWAPYGEIFFDKYDKTILTHWHPLPDVPNK
jgi:hypothetical protein